jgi:hypothetical protein
MGNAQAAGYAAMVEDDSVSLTQAVSAHMSSNLYPAPPAYMVPVAVAAIEAVQNDPEFGPGENIDLPEHVEFRGGVVPTAYDIIESFRLDAFV